MYCLAVITTDLEYKYPDYNVSFFETEEGVTHAAEVQLKSSLNYGWKIESERYKTMVTGYVCRLKSGRDRRIIDISEVTPEDPHFYDYLIKSEL